MIPQFVEQKQQKKNEMINSDMSDLTLRSDYKWYGRCHSCKSRHFRSDGLDAVRDLRMNDVIFLIFHIFVSKEYAILTRLGSGACECVEKLGYHNFGNRVFFLQKLVFLFLLWFDIYHNGLALISYGSVLAIDSNINYGIFRWIFCWRLHFFSIQQNGNND